MTAAPVILVGHVDVEDRFIDGDDAFTALNERAGGTLGSPLGVPQLAAVVRLVRRLRIPVTRPITIADAEADLDCWVSARPDADGVVISLAEVRERSAARSPPPPHIAPPPPGADWTWETDAELRLRRVDAEAASRRGIDVASALGRPLSRVFTLQAGADGAMPLLEALAERRDFDGQHARLPDGSPAVLAATARFDAAGALLGFVGAVFDDAAAAQDACVDAAGFQNQLETALRTPLGRIVAEADAMNAQVDGPLAPHYVDYAADIASAGRHLLTLVDDLADLNAIERPGFQVAADEIDLADAARRAAGLLAVRAADSDVALERPAAEARLAATGEFRRILQILVNLVTNAVRYAPRGSAVTVSVERSGGRALVHVADAGKGIAPEDQQRIFDKFERVDLGEPGGSGLGLYIARRLARAMGGDLTLESTPGEGARFTLALPAR